MSGKLIVIEGLDGSGKSTQLDVLTERLTELGVDNKKISFPDYDEPSSTLVKMYLSGEFGSEPSDVNAYAASLFYAVDRYASFKKYWKDYYENGGIVIAGRYVTSNAVHQMSKLPRDEWQEYLDWLADLEYVKNGIPKPDLVILLDVSPDVSQKMLEKRYNGDETKKDIHENNVDYLKHCRTAAKFGAEHGGWVVIKCDDRNSMRSINDISDDILREVKKII